MKKRSIKSYYRVLLTLCVLLSFSYGFLVHRHQLFPYSLMRLVAFNTGLVDPPGGRLELDSRSGALAALNANPYIRATVTLNPDKRGVQIHDAGM